MLPAGFLEPNSFCKFHNYFFLKHDLLCVCNIYHERARSLQKAFINTALRTSS